MLLNVTRKNLIAQDTFEFELVSPDGAELPPFAAGAHVDVHLPGGAVRQYSLCNKPSERHRYLLGVLRAQDSRGGSAGMHDHVHTGHRIEVSEPKNHFALAQGSHRSLLFAGGIGITPILCMAEQLSASGALFEMHYSCRSRARSAFYERMQRAPFARDVVFRFDDEEAGRPLNVADVLLRQDADTHLYVCGPNGFMDAVLGSARASGWDEARLHYEFFGADPSKRIQDGAAFNIKLARSGRIVSVPSGQTVVEALAEAGVKVPVSCEQGVCGTCLTRVIDGEPDHRDMYLTPDEQARNDQFTPCCSRSKSPVLVVDL